MKTVTDTIQFDTKKDLQQIANILRAYGGQIEKLDANDPFGGLGGAQPDIAILVWGNLSFLDGLKHPFAAATSDWGVQVIVTNQGVSRHIELTAIGEKGLLEQSWSINYGGRKRFFKLVSSKEHRDKIAAMLA